VSYVIDKDKRIGCGACVPQCAAEAIEADEDKYYVSVFDKRNNVKAGWLAGKI
jgi:ferredoxin